MVVVAVVVTVVGAVVAVVLVGAVVAVVVVSGVVVVSPPVVDEPPVVVVVGCVVLVVEVDEVAEVELVVVSTWLITTAPFSFARDRRDCVSGFATGHTGTSAPAACRFCAAATACGVAALPASTSTLMSTFGLSPVFTSET